MLGRLFKVIWAIVLITGVFQAIEWFKKDWPIDQDRSIVDQVIICHFANLNSGGENYIALIDTLGLRPDVETAVGLAVQGRPRFSRPYNCFANLSQEQVRELNASEDYRTALKILYQKMNKTYHFGR
ncbi:hypothetical protein SAMN05428995_105218 [Loktanella sp. DSM 29012]|nr:hypothetical protein SAMN05428995_105218 [Loktanella sp. DSM 29012]